MNFHLHTIQPDLEKVGYNEWGHMMLSGRQIKKAFVNKNRLQTTEGEFKFEGKPELFHFMILDDTMYGSCFRVCHVEGNMVGMIMNFSLSSIPEPFKLCIVPAHSKLSEFKLSSLFESLNRLRPIKDSDQCVLKLDSEYFNN